MSILTRITDFFSLAPMQPVETRGDFTFGVVPSLEQQLAKLHRRTALYKLPSIYQALGVPSIQRAVTLISNTVGSLPMQSYRNGVLMDPAPQVITRPDPFSTPRDCYRDMAYQMATRGETVLWIASRDPDNTASALIVVPLNELNVEENPRNRLYPIYTWGNIRSTRYSPANTSGQFVHITYLKDPLALRGMGPLQMAGAASSVAVEAQEWAARFYQTGGYPSIELHTEMDLNDAESADLLAQWTEFDSNTPKVTTGQFEVREHGVNEQGAQMLQAREFNNGDAARLYGMPGMLLEYSSPGSSLTYQNITEVWTSFAKGCLIPNYLEPIEQGLGDLLPRSTVTRFYVDGLLRADIKTRYDVYDSGITSGVLTVEQAQIMEGLVPGSPELVPVKPTPPASVPASIPFSIGTPSTRMAGPVRCDGRRVRDGRLVTCNKLLAEAGPFVGTCPRCRKAYAPEPEMRVEAPPPVVNVYVPEQRPPVTYVTVEPTQVRVEPTHVNVAPAIVGEDHLARFDARFAAIDAAADELRTAVLEAERRTYDRLAEKARPRLVTPIRDPKSGQIVSATIEDAAEAG